MKTVLLLRSTRLPEEILADCSKSAYWFGYQFVTDLPAMAKRVLELEKITNSNEEYIEQLVGHRNSLIYEKEKLAAQVEALKEDLAAADRDEKVQFAGYERLEAKNDALRKALGESLQWPGAWNYTNAQLDWLVRVGALLAADPEEGKVDAELSPL